MFNTNVSSLDRQESLLRLYPQLQFSSQDNVLYIGASKLRFQFQELLKTSNLDIVEIYKDNVDYLRSLKWIKNVYHDNILKFTPNKLYKVILFWHGPEHLQQEEIIPLLKRMENWATEVIILGCPNGLYEQGEVYGNKNEEHLCHIRNGYLNELGYVTESLGEPDIMGGNITAVKFKESVYPWFTPKACQYLHNYISQKHGCNILEFGCGRSTVWFSKFTNNIISIEHNKEWRDKTFQLCHTDIKLIDRPYSSEVSNYEPKFDIISVDGRDRVMCVKSSIDKLRDGGIFILDNSDRLEYTEAILLLNDKYGKGLKFSGEWETTIWKNY